jgi:AcrR family transcriptional regulator
MYQVNSQQQHLRIYFTSIRSVGVTYQGYGSTEGQESGMARALRADAERSVRAILDAAERVLAEDSGASMEQIAEAAGLTRITVHRRFANRQALLEALSVSAMQQLLEAIEEARPNSAPALVALYRVTANVLRVKSAWRFTLTHNTSLSEAAAALWADIDAHTVELLARAQREGLLANTTDLDWMRQLYYALLGEVINRPAAEQDSAEQDPDALATLVIDTLLHGGGPRG